MFLLKSECGELSFGVGNASRTASTKIEKIETFIEDVLAPSIQVVRGRVKKTGRSDGFKVWSTRSGNKIAEIDGRSVSFLTDKISDVFRLEFAVEAIFIVSKVGDDNVDRGAIDIDGGVDKTSQFSSDGRQEDVFGASDGIQREKSTAPCIFSRFGSIIGIVVEMIGEILD